MKVNSVAMKKVELGSAFAALATNKADECKSPDAA
jgi:hypothetical protein